MFLHKSYGISILLFDQIPDFFKKSLCLNNSFLFFHIFLLLASSWAFLGPGQSRHAHQCFILGSPWCHLGPARCHLGQTYRLLGSTWWQLGLTWRLLGATWCYLCSTWRASARFVGCSFVTLLLSDALRAILSWYPCVHTLRRLYFRDYHASLAVVAPLLDLSWFLDGAQGPPGMLFWPSAGLSSGIYWGILVLLCYSLVLSCVLLGSSGSFWALPGSPGLSREVLGYPWLPCTRIQRGVISFQKMAKVCCFKLMMFLKSLSFFQIIILKIGLIAITCTCSTCITSNLFSVNLGLSQNGHGHIRYIWYRLVPLISGLYRVLSLL